MNFKNFSSLTAMTCILIAGFWVLTPFDVDLNKTHDIVNILKYERYKASAVLAGVAIMFYLSRNTEEPDERRPLVIGYLVICVLLSFVYFMK